MVLSVSLFWPGKCDSLKKQKRQRKRTKDKRTAKSKPVDHEITTSCNLEEPLPDWETSKNTPIGAHRPSSLAKSEGPAPSENSASVTSQTNGSTANSKSTPLATSASSGSSPSVDGSVSSANSVDLTACSNVHFESRDGLPGVCYKDTENTASWTPVVGRLKKRP